MSADRTGARVQHPGPDTIDGLLDWRARVSPEGTAFWRLGPHGGWERTTWRAFRDDVVLLASALQAAGMKRGDRIGMIAPVSIDWERLHHAALMSGISVAGMDGHDLPTRLAAMMETAQLRAVVVPDLNLVRSLWPLLSAGTRQRLAFAIELSPGDPSHPPPCATFTLPGLLQLAGDPARIDRAGVADEATVIFTSGTTGAPKGIAYSHAQVMLAIHAIGSAFDAVGEEGRLLCWLPLSNLFQRVVNLAAIRNGAATYLLGDPRTVMDHVATVSPDLFIGVPRFYEKLVQGIRARVSGMPGWLAAPLLNAWQRARRVRATAIGAAASGDSGEFRWHLRARLDSWLLSRVRQVLGKRVKCLISGSAPLSSDLRLDLEALGWPVMEAYGLSENVVPMAMNRLGDARPGSVGRPLPENDIRIEADGSIHVRGPGVADAYLGEPRGARLDGNGYYATGDLGRFDDEGFLYLTGRSGDLIKTSTGRRVAPAAVEAVLQSATGTDQAVVFGAGRKFLLALVTVLPGHTDARQLPALRAQLQSAVARLSPHERPAGIVLTETALSLADGEVTANLKLRRTVIESRHGPLLDALALTVDQGPHPAADCLIVLARDLERRVDRSSVT